MCGMEAAVQAPALEELRLGPGGWELHAVPIRRHGPDHREAARAAVWKESVGQRQEWEGPVWAMAGLPQRFSRQRWQSESVSRLAKEARAHLHSSPSCTGRGRSPPRRSSRLSGQALLPSLVHKRCMVPLEASAPPSAERDGSS